MLLLMLLQMLTFTCYCQYISWHSPRQLLQYSSCGCDLHCMLSWHSPMLLLLLLLL
jgi:hypothetical protein